MPPVIYLKSMFNYYHHTNRFLFCSLRIHKHFIHINFITMNFSTLLALVTTATLAVAAGPIEIYVTRYHTVDYIQYVTETSTQIVLETQYVSL